MASPNELSIEEIRKYLLNNGGLARNHDLVKYFKNYLTDPLTRVEARNKFKEYVNTLATIKNEDGEKYLVLKKKYRTNFEDVTTKYYDSGSPISTSDFSTPTSPVRDPPPYRPPPPAPLSPTSSDISSPSSSSYRVADDLYATVNKRNHSEVNSPIASPPIVPPRRKSQDKFRLENKENNISIDKLNNSLAEEIKDDDGTSGNSGIELPSFRERMQRFNQMACETDLPGRPNGTTTPTKKRTEKGTEEDDRASVASQLDGKSREWLVRAAQGDYHALAKLAAEEPRLTRLKDPSSGTALHWAAKHGNEDIVKLIAGTYKDYIKSVNETTNGGYTALHVAMQFNNENIFNLLVQVYGANQEIRDHSGKKARQYLPSQKAAVSQDTFRKIKARKKHAEKDLGFLRIGSLNVRVKRTTEAFSQFLGVASSTSNNSDKIHKTWGSADNIQENTIMPPPKYAPIKKRRSKKAQDFLPTKNHAASQPSTPLPINKEISTNSRIMQKRPSSTTAISTNIQTAPDSDSDGACGFDSAWRGSAQL
ncbi:ankyrin repeat domain-containing protein SOWAHB isoform X2 [Aphidius gifuensis]|uniref:ankyrin repeat domain-containing protein SOWAHB isoform X2 n=1 Tax=Aphidius gifuensis TaxID=684658 RepID=UPI001CDB5670|nr:ankyrin repeat domain-containing protein SOWAHB isoform X2 [Aphidius gifuensis]